VGGWTFFCIICGQKQYRDAVKLMENISTFKKRVQYAHYRPNVSISADKNAWWKYTYAAITEQRRRARYMIPILFDVSNSYWKNKIKFRLWFHQLLSKLFSKFVDQEICVYISYGFANLLIYLWGFFFLFSAVGICHGRISWSTQRWGRIMCQNTLSCSKPIQSKNPSTRIRKFRSLIGN
jgi:hypothetical protein